MSPRPRKASDEEIVAATQRAMQRLGPGELSLAEIAAEAGVTPGALVQRFGSKRDLLLVVMKRWAEGAGEMMAAFRAGRRSPLGAVRNYASCMAGMGSTPAALAHHLTYLQMDLSDPDFRQEIRRASKATRQVIASWLDEAVQAGELRPATDTRVLARLLETLIGGSLLAWAAWQDGAARAWVLRDVDALLAPHRRTRN